MVLSYPNLGFEGMISNADVDVSFDSTWASTDANSMSVGLISAYSGSDYDSTDLTWDGDAYVDGWLGLAPNSVNANYNVLARLDT